ASSASGAARPQILTVTDTHSPVCSSLPPVWPPAGALLHAGALFVLPGPQARLGGRNFSRGGGACSLGTMLGSAPAACSASSRAESSLTSRSSRRAVRRQRPCRNQAAVPPIT